VKGHLACCAHIARTDGARVRGVRGPVPAGARVSSMPGLRFRAIADMTPLAWQVGQGTANAVGWRHPPGFKSPILRHRLL